MHTAGPAVAEEAALQHLRSHDRGKTYSVPWAEGSGYTAAADYPQPCDDCIIMHQDADVVIVNKPAFLPTENTRQIKDSVRARVEAALAVQGEPTAELHVAHRLDWETSGLLILARHAAAMRSLSRQFADRGVAKKYTADVVGAPPRPSGIIDLPLAADRLHPPRQCVDLQAGKPAKTRWAVVANEGGGGRDLGGEGRSDGDAGGSDRSDGDGGGSGGRNGSTRCVRLRLSPESGRRHQLRLHMLALGCPMVGDTLYAPPPGATHPRLHLHASELGFEHPATGEWMVFTSPPPFTLPVALPAAATAPAQPCAGLRPAALRCWNAVCGCALGTPTVLLNCLNWL